MKNNLPTSRCTCGIDGVRSLLLLFLLTVFCMCIYASRLCCYDCSFYTILLFSFCIATTPAATTPFLELYVTLERTEAQQDKYILEEPVEGLPLVAAVLFQEGDASESSDKQGGVTVTLRISYLLPSMC